MMSSSDARVFESYTSSSQSSMNLDGRKSYESHASEFKKVNDHVITDKKRDCVDLVCKFTDRLAKQKKLAH